MYTFSNKLKTFSIVLMILGLLGVGYGFMTSHKSVASKIMDYWYKGAKSATAESSQFIKVY